MLYLMLPSYRTLSTALSVSSLSSLPSERPPDVVTAPGSEAFARVEYYILGLGEKGCILVYLL